MKTCGTEVADDYFVQSIAVEIGRPNVVNPPGVGGFLLVRVGPKMLAFGTIGVELRRGDRTSTIQTFGRR